MKPLDEETWNMLDYFWSAKGDLTRWCGWEEFRAANPHHPIVGAYERFKAAEATIGLLIRGAQP